MTELKNKSLFQKLQSEYRKIHWPTRQEIVKYTATVVSVTLVLSVVIFGFDTIFSNLIGLLLK